MGMELAIFGQIVVGLALCLPTILAASVSRAAPEMPCRLGRYVSTTAGHRKHALYAAPTRS